MTRTVSTVLPDLANYYGTLGYLRHRIVPVGPGLLLTDGARYVAEEAGAYWLMDKVLLNAKDWLLEGDGFCSVELLVKDSKGKLIVEDGDGGLLHDEDIEYTDFPEPGIRFFLQDGSEPVLMLQSEY